MLLLRLKPSLYLGTRYRKDLFQRVIKRRIFAPLILRGRFGAMRFFARHARSVSCRAGKVNPVGFSVARYVRIH